MIRKEFLLKEKQRTDFNKRNKVVNLRELAVSEKVWIVDLKMYGAIVENTKFPRSYVV